MTIERKIRKIQKEFPNLANQMEKIPDTNAGVGSFFRLLDRGCLRAEERYLLQEV